MANPQKTRRNPSIIESSKYAPGQPPPVDDRRRRLEALGQDRAAIAHAKQEIAQISRQQNSGASAQVQLDDVEVQERRPRQMVAAPAPDAPQSVAMPDALGDMASIDQKSPARKVAPILRPAASEQQKAQWSGGMRPPGTTFERTEHPPVRSAAPARSMPLAQGAVYPRDERYTVPPLSHDIYQPWEMSAPPARGQLFVLLLVSLVCLAVIWMFLQNPKTFISSYNGAGFGNTVGDVVGGFLFNQAAASRIASAHVPAGEHSVLGDPSISAAAIDTILSKYGSPAAGTGQTWIKLGQQYGIDPAYAVAFFIHESSAGTSPGWAGMKPDGSTTHNVGNIICAGYATCYNRFRDYTSWDEGIADWYKLISQEYVSGRGAASVEQIIPIYAPASDNNDVPGYISVVVSMVEGWRQGVLR
jgi:Mannosyl-glycoprotein endo-beta-N-acetylglucosaminidase